MGIDWDGQGKGIGCMALGFWYFCQCIMAASSFKHGGIQEQSYLVLIFVMCLIREGCSLLMRNRVATPAAAPRPIETRLAVRACSVRDASGLLKGWRRRGESRLAREGLVIWIFHHLHRVAIQPVGDIGLLQSVLRCGFARLQPFPVSMISFLESNGM